MCSRRTWSTWAIIHQDPVSSPLALVYPALFSRVAESLRSRITHSDIVKDGLTYKNAFRRCQAIKKIVYIIKTTDLKLALLLGRASTHKSTTTP